MLLKTAVPLKEIEPEIGTALAVTAANSEAAPVSANHVFFIFLFFVLFRCLVRYGFSWRRAKPNLSLVCVMQHTYYQVVG